MRRGDEYTSGIHFIQQGAPDSSSGIGASATVISAYNLIMAVHVLVHNEPVTPDVPCRTSPETSFFFGKISQKNLEALHVDNARTSFVILSLGDPHLPTQLPIVKEMKLK